jgi:hypothetical protein
MKNKCNHQWFYAHTIWQGNREGDVAILRWCHGGCKKSQSVNIRNIDWKPVPKSQADMRETAALKLSV